MADQTVIDRFLTPSLHEASVQQRETLVSCILIAHSTGKLFIGVPQRVNQCFACKVRQQVARGGKSDSRRIVGQCFM